MKLGLPNTWEPTIGLHKLILLKEKVTAWMIMVTHKDYSSLASTMEQLLPFLAQQIVFVVI